MNSNRARKFFKIITILSIGLLFIGCSYENDPLRKQIGSYRNYVNIQGSIKDNIYVSPDNLYQFQVPSLLEPGGRIKDSFQKDFNGGISFSDDMGSLIRVDYITLDYFKGASKSQIFENVDKILDVELYKPTKMNISLLHKEKIDDNKMFVIFDFPKGSTLFVNEHRINAVRASICFIKNNYLFVITRQSNESLWKSVNKYNDIDSLRKILLEDFHGFK